MIGLEGLVQGWWAGQNQRAANDWNERGMQSRHQWEVNDLNKAGLNPILSAGGTPGGISGAPPAPVPDLSNSVSSAWQRKLMDAQTESTLADAESKSNLADWYKEQTQKTRLEQDNIATDNYLKMRMAGHYDFMNPNVAALTDLAKADTSFRIADSKRIPFSIEGLKAAASRDRSSSALNLGGLASNAKQQELLREQIYKLGYENVGNKIEADIDSGGAGELGRLIDRFKTLIGISGSARQADQEFNSGRRRR